MGGRVWEEEHCVNMEGSSCGYQSSAMLKKQTIKEIFRVTGSSGVRFVFYMVSDGKTWEWQRIRASKMLVRKIDQHELFTQQGTEGEGQ